MSVAGWPRYDRYKDSGVAWIGEIPSTWRVERGKWLFEKKDRPVRPKDEVVTCFRDGQVTLRRNRRTEGFTNALKEHGYQGIRKGDLVIHAMDAFAGAVGVSDSDGKATPVYSVCVPRGPDIADEYFFAYYMRHLALSGLLVSLAKGIRERSTDFRYNDFADLKLPVPPLPEQRAIARFLDEKCAKVDEAVRIRERQIALLRERRQILIQQAVTRGLNPAAPMKDSGIDWIGQIPAHWEVARLKHLASIRYGLGQPPREIDSGLPLLRATNVERGKINSQDLVYVDEEAVPKGRNAFLKAGEIIVVRSGAYTGDSAVVPQEYEGAVAGYDMVVTPNSSDSNFLGYALLSPYVLHEQIFLLRMRAAQPHLNREELAETLIVAPPIGEQREIVEHIDKASQKIDAAISIKEQQIAALREYKASLIDAAVTGKIRVTAQAAGHAGAAPETELSA